MKLRSILLCLMLGLASVCFGSPEFIGVLVSQGVTHLAVRGESQGRMHWVKIGEEFDGYRLKLYDSQRELLILQRGDSEVQVALKSAAVQPAPTRVLLESLVKAGDANLRAALDQAKQLEDRRDETAKRLSKLEAQTGSQVERVSVVNEVRRKLKIEEDNLEFFYQRLMEEARKRATTR